LSWPGNDGPPQQSAQERAEQVKETAKDAAQRAQAAGAVIGGGRQEQAKSSAEAVKKVKNRSGSG
jgi:hypothetical protein